MIVLFNIYLLAGYANTTSAIDAVQFGVSAQEL